MSMRSPLRYWAQPLLARLHSTHERGPAPLERGPLTPSVSPGPVTYPGGAGKFFQQPAVWAAAGLLGGGVAWATTQHQAAATQIRRAQSPTHVEIAHALSDGELRRRLGAFVDTLQRVEAVELHWWNPTTARVVGDYLEGDIRVREGWLDVTMRVHGPLQSRSQDLHGWMVHNLRRIMDV